MHHNYCAQALEPTGRKYSANMLQLLKPTDLESVLHIEKTLQWEAQAPQQRVVPIHCNQTKPQHSNKDPAQAK